MWQNELNKQEERRKELEMLALKKEVDADFAKNEAEKRLRKYKEARDLGNHHMKQTVSGIQTSKSNILSFILLTVFLWTQKKYHKFPP